MDWTIVIGLVVGVSLFLLGGWLRRNTGQRLLEKPHEKADRTPREEPRG